MDRKLEHNARLAKPRTNAHKAITVEQTKTSTNVVLVSAIRLRLAAPLAEQCGE